MRLSTSVNYFKSRGVRVVNMSWGGDLASIDTALEQNHFTGTPEQRRALAKQIYQIGYTKLYNAMQADPTTLYCIAAGNSDNDVEFSDVFPSSFKLPNVLVVGGRRSGRRPDLIYIVRQRGRLQRRL